MGDDSRQLPLERRVPGATGAGPAKSAQPELPEALLQRMQAVVSAAHAQAKQEQEQEARPVHAELPDQTARPESSTSWSQLLLGAASVLKPPNGKTRSRQSGSPTGQPPDEDAGSDTAPQPRLTASGALASPVINNVELQPDCAAQPRQERARPAGQERQRPPDAESDSEADRGAQAERERAAEADRGFASQTERLKAIEAERKAEAERGAQAERERAAQAERERTEQAEREQAEEAKRERSRAAQLERIRADRATYAREREQTRRKEAERIAQRSLTAQSGESAESASAMPPAKERATPVVQTPANLQERRPRPSMWKAPIRRHLRVGALVVAGAVLLATGWLVLEHPSHTPTHSRGMNTADNPKVIRNQAAAWVAQQVGRTDVVSCDPSMCQVLKAQGIPAYDVLILGSKGANLFGSTIVVATAAVRNQFGSRLDSVYAPAVLASFGSGKARIDIRQTAPHGPAAYWSALRADQQERRSIEPTLAESLQVVASATVGRALRAGQVDLRLYFLLDGMATDLAQPIQITALGDLSAGASPGIPFRSATLAGSTANLRKLLTFAQALKPPLVPALSKITRLDGQPALVVAFTAPSPLGLPNVDGS